MTNRGKKNFNLLLICIGLILYILSEIIFRHEVISYTIHVIINVIIWVFIGYYFYKYYKK